MYVFSYLEHQSDERVSTGVLCYRKKKRLRLFKLAGMCDKLKERVNKTWGQVFFVIFLAFVAQRLQAYLSISLIVDFSEDKGMMFLRLISVGLYFANK